MSEGKGKRGKKRGQKEGLRNRGMGNKPDEIIRLESEIERGCKTTYNAAPECIRKVGRGSKQGV